MTEVLAQTPVCNNCTSGHFLCGRSDLREQLFIFEIYLASSGACGIASTERVRS